MSDKFGRRPLMLAGKEDYLTSFLYILNVFLKKNIKIRNQCHGRRIGTYRCLCY